MKATAFVNIWDSECNESYKFYLPIDLSSNDVSAAVHQAVCEELELEEDDWDLVYSINPTKYIYSIVMKCGQEVMTYSVKFHF
jgi:hypothetical protein